MKLSEIQDLIKFVAKSGVNEVDLETKDIKINIKAKGKGGDVQQVVVAQPAAQPVAVPPPAAAPAPAAPAPKKAAKQAKDAPAAEEDDSKYITVKSPMIGTFYRSSSPDKPAFVNVGDDIAEGKVVCIIEAMKLFNEIESEVKGKIVKILVDDATPVEYDQPLFLVDPS